MLVAEDRMVYQHNADDTWSEAIPLPFFGLRKVCQCGKKFWKVNNYKRHYQKAHTNGIAYSRTPQGLVVIDRRFQ